MCASSRSGLRAAAFLAAILLSYPAAAYTLTTMDAWSGSTGISALGDGSRAGAFGQTFIAPADSPVLESFTIQVSVENGSLRHGPFYFGAYLAAFQDLRPTNPILYESSEITVQEGLGYVSVAFDTGGVRLTPSGEYILFFSPNEYLADYLESAGASLGATSTNPYSGGRVVWTRSSAFNSLFTWAWSEWSAYDLAFEANFSGVPEPAAWPLAGCGLAAIAGFGLRGRRRRS